MLIQDEGAARLRARFSVVAVILACLALCTALRPAGAQLNETGTVTGTVTDESGGVIPGAAVTITNVGTKVATQLKTNGSGEFTQVGLNVGNYTVSVMMTGFESYEKTNFYLGPTSVYTVKVAMKPGSTTETVEVAADAVVPELASNEISTEISGKETEEMALGGHNYQQLSTLMPGVVNLAADTTMATGGYVANNQVSVNGMGVSSVFYTLDGVWNEETGNLLTNTITPPPEAIDQIKVLQNNYSVQYNMMGGAMFMVHTKSGTNQFHGEACYFARNQKFNAVNFFVPTIGSGNLPFRWNIGGLGIGGPLFIPKLYNTERQKTFFYLNGQYVKEVAYQVQLGTPATQDEINGIFPGEIKDPATGNDFPTQPGGPSGLEWVIPQNKIVPAAQAMLKAFTPAQNATNGCTGVISSSSCDIVQRSSDTYVDLNPSIFKQLNMMGKIDHVINDRLKLTGEYFREGVRDQLPSAQRMGSQFPGNYDIFFNNDSVAQVHLLHQISPAMTNQITVAMDRYIVTHTYGGITHNTDIPNFATQLAYPANIIGLGSGWLPDITFSSGWSQFGVNSNDTQWRTAYLAETLTDNWNWTRGKHSFAAGGTFLLGRSRINAEGDNTTGTFNFNGNATGTPIADFLTGYANTYTQGNAMVRKELTYPIYSPYLEDQWKIKPRLTLTLGVRYIFEPFANAQQGYATAFSPAAFNPAQAPVVDIQGFLHTTPSYNPTNGFIYNGFNGVPYNLSSAHENYVSPSVGFAWDIYGTGRMSLRGGYSMNFLKSGSSSDCQATCIGLPAVTQIELSNARFPNPLNGQATAPTAVSATGEDTANIQAAKIHSYSLSIEQQYPHNWISEIAFAGVAGRNLPLELNINQVKPVGSNNYDPVLNAANPPNTASLAPYQGYSTILYATSSGFANWNALETSLRHPVGRTLMLRTQFTWSHGMADVPSTQGYADENSGVQDSYHPYLDYGNTLLNQHLSFSSGLIYDMPFFPHAWAWSKEAFGGWQLAAITAFLSGTSHTAGLSISSHGLTTRPDINPDYPAARYHGSFFYSKKSSSSGQAVGPFFQACHYLVPGETTECDPSSHQPSGFTSPNFSGMFGNEKVGDILGPGTIVDNISLVKLFPIHEQLTLRFRAEAFNLTNHPNFNSADYTLGDANFGYYTGAGDPRELEFGIELNW